MITVLPDGSIKIEEDKVLRKIFSSVLISANPYYYHLKLFVKDVHNFVNFDEYINNDEYSNS